MQSVGITSAKHKASRKLVDDDYFAVADNVINVALHYTVSLYSLIDIVRKLRIFHIGQVLNAKCFFSLFNTACCKHGTSRLFIDDIISAKLVGVLFGVDFFDSYLLE